LGAHAGKREDPASAIYVAVADVDEHPGWSSSEGHRPERSNGRIHIACGQTLAKQNSHSAGSG
jgi:hypothetical protein